MKIGIVGLPNVGKSTLFKALTRNNVDINNYPFCTIEPNVGIVEVPDQRLEKLSQLSQSKKTIPAVVEFVDIAGLVKGASKGEGLGNKFLANVREVDAVIEVVRAFENPNITHVHNKVNPVYDIDIINTELILADLETLEKRKEKLNKDIKKGNQEAIQKKEILEQIKNFLEKEEMIEAKKIKGDKELVKKVFQEISLLTAKPFLYVFNVSDLDKKLDDKLEKLPHLKLDIKIEEELNEVTAKEKEELGLESKLNKLIQEAYRLLNLITFFTTGEKETRAWTIHQGSLAPQAGSAIHTDFEKKFINADVIFWKKLLEAGSWLQAKEKGMIQTVGKDYLVRDGDVIEFRI